MRRVLWKSPEGQFKKVPRRVPKRGNVQSLWKGSLPPAFPFPFRLKVKREGRERDEG